MLTAAFWLLCAASALGGGLAFLFIRGPRSASPPSAVLAAHAVIGAAGFAVLIFALRQRAPHSGMGTAGFGPVAGALLCLALAIGLFLAYASWRRRRPSEMLVGTHASLAIAGLVLVLTLVALG